MTNTCSHFTVCSCFPVGNGDEILPDLKLEIRTLDCEGQGMEIVLRSRKIRMELIHAGLENLMETCIFPLFLHKQDTENATSRPADKEKPDRTLVVATNMCGNTLHLGKGYHVKTRKKKKWYTAFYVSPLSALHRIRITTAGTFSRLRIALQWPPLHPLLRCHLHEPRSACVSRCDVPPDHRGLAAHHLVENAALDEVITNR